ncbi:MAG: rhodanese-related sulfurtransferase [Gammaproteobacteria bacterium]|nr:rhodanese-related sulfurtransferase [Gammaproteobacteria bacterium]
MSYRVCAFYRFLHLENLSLLQGLIKSRLIEAELCGTVLLAPEGINGTVAGQGDGTFQFFDWLQSQLGLSNLKLNQSWCEYPPFKRTKVKIKKEIVTLGIEGINPIKQTGTYVSPDEWNTLIEDPEVLLIDTRNDYEVEVGRFKGAISPDTVIFRDFPDYVKKHLDPEQNPKIAMYCTGGIRCEKASAYLKQNGFREVFQLQGGILNYLKTIPNEQSSWEGECFVFDDRTTLDDALASGEYDQCHACRRPISELDKQSEKYTKGVSCPKCYDQKSDRDRLRYAERERQTCLSDLRGDEHIGPNSQANPANRKAGKCDTAKESPV